MSCCCSGGDLDVQLAVQSYCFREFKDNAQVASMVRELGLSAIELCGVHVDFDNPAVFDQTIDIYRKAGVKIVSIGVETFGTLDKNYFKNRFDFVRKAGCQNISVHFNPDTFLAVLPIAYEFCDEYGVNLAIHNHGSYHWLGNEGILKWIFSITRPCIGLNMDTAWALDATQDPVKWANQFAGRLYATHLKDFVFDRAGKWSDTIVGQGNLNLAALLTALKTNKFAGPAIVEFEGDAKNPLPSLKQCVADIRSTLAKI